MLLRKLYLKIRLFLYSIRHILNRIAIILMVAILAYFFVNGVLLETFILKKANESQLENKYEDAITLYNIAYSYYKIDHFSDNNKKAYLELPYKIAMCYLNQKDMTNSVNIMMEGLTAVQQQYGYFSKENAYFIRKYVIKYFLEINKIKLANQEFEILFNIYRKTGVNKNDISEMFLLSGDLFYKQKNYTRAIEAYEKAYNNIINQDDMDYEIFAEIIHRICDYEIKANQNDLAVNLYTQSIKFLKSSDSKKPYLIADMLINLGNLYIKSGNSDKNAIECYEEAVAIIKKLPKKSLLKQNITTYLKTLKELYNKTGQFDKVNKIDVELARQRRFSFLY